MLQARTQLLASLMTATVLLASWGARVQAATSAGGYSITHYDVQIDVAENNTYAITETIDVNFAEERHGIYRLLPRRSHLIRADGRETNGRAEITNISVNAPFTVSREGSNERIRIGDSEETVSGKQQYVISYTYNAGADPLRDEDEFYYNLIGDGWDVGMDEVTFSVSLPKDFDASGLGISVGQTGSIDASRAQYNVAGHVITGSVPGGIQPGEAVTLRLVLPEGYYVGAGFPFNTAVLVAALVSVVIALYTFWLWQEHGRDDPVVETVEFYPPPGLNSAEVGLAYDGTITNDAAISLLIYLADKGFVRLVDTGEKRKNKSFRIERVKDYVGTSTAERTFFHGLFLRGDNVDGDDLQNRFYQTLNEVKSTIIREKQALWWDPQADKFQKITFALTLLAGGLTFGVPLVQNGRIDLLLGGLIFLGVFTGTFCLSRSSRTRLIGMVGISSVSLALWIVGICPLLIDEPIALVMDAVGLVASITALIFTSLMGKLSPAGTELLGKVGGFRRFLETAEKPKLEALVAADPHYFYNILPYTFALGVSAVWVERFRDIALEPPDWYSSPHPFNAARFDNFVNSTVRNASAAMASSPNSSGTGGGVSGGGGGGGGGGSW